MIEPKARKATGLGRGLSALLGDANGDVAAESGVIEVPVDRLKPNRFQPRVRFDDAAIAELVASIGEKGVLQPLLARRLGGSDYEIIAGERRWRAAQAAGLDSVPVIVKDLDDSESLEIALIENIQRENLNAIEEAAAYRRLMAEFGHTQIAVGQLVGKSRSHVANILRLLDLPQSVQAMVSDGRLTMGHARAIVAADDPVALAREVIRRGFNVRQTEARAKLSESERAEARERDPNTLALERDLSSAVGLKVTIRDQGEQGGAVSLHYRTLEQLDEICRRLCQKG